MLINSNLSASDENSHVKTEDDIFHGANFNRLLSECEGNSDLTIDTIRSNHVCLIYACCCSTTRVLISRNEFCFAFVIQEIMTTGPPIWMNYLLDYHLVTNLMFQESMLDMPMIR